VTDHKKYYFEKDSELFVESHKKATYLFYGKQIGSIHINLAELIDSSRNYFTYPLDANQSILVTLKLQVVAEHANVIDQHNFSLVSELD
jgi:hypothetical protein